MRFLASGLWTVAVSHEFDLFHVNHGALGPPNLRELFTIQILLQGDNVVFGCFRDGFLATRSDPSQRQ